MQDYRKLLVWQKGHRLAVDVHALAPLLLRPDAWALRDQVLRAAISIPSNVAEGTGRGSNPDFKRFLWHSMGSCNELEAQLLLGRDLKFIPTEQHAKLATRVSEVRRMLTRLIQTLK